MSDVREMLHVPNGPPRLHLGPSSHLLVPRASHPLPPFLFLIPLAPLVLHPVHLCPYRPGPCYRCTLAQQHKGGAKASATSKTDAVAASSPEASLLHAASKGLVLLPPPSACAFSLSRAHGSPCSRPALLACRHASKHSCSQRMRASRSKHASRNEHA